MNLYLSIDVGTSSTKLSLFDGQGRLAASRSAAYTVDYPRPEWAEQDPREWWQAVCRLGPEIMQSVGSGTLRAISVSGQTPLCAPVDENGQPLRPAILWLDRRATAQADWLREHIGEQRCRQVSVNRLDSYFGGLKALWLKQAEPEIFARTWKIFQASSYVIYHLTGQSVIDPAQAGLCSPCFNFSTQQWDPDLCRDMGIPLEMLPEVHPAAEVIGAVTAAGSQASGLPEGTPVVCGGGDFACACLGAGVIHQGAAMMLGTAGNLLFPGVENHDPRLLHTIHLTGEALPFGGVMAGGNLSWFAGLLGDTDPHLFARLDDEAARVPPGSEGLVFLPYLMGERTPIWDPAARGAFVGLSSRHTRGHLYRAILEGVSFALRQIANIAYGDAIAYGEIEDGNRVAGSERPAITAIDGGSRSPLWRQILADVLALPIREGGAGSGTALGSAFLAALGAGDAASFDAIQTWAQPGSLTDPDPSACRKYDQVYPVFAGLYAKLKPDFDRLNEG